MLKVSPVRKQKWGYSPAFQCKGTRAKQTPKIKSLGWEVLLYHPYSSDLSAIDLTFVSSTRTFYKWQYI